MPLCRYGDVVYVTMAGVPIVVVHGHRNVKEAFGQHQLSARPELHVTTRALTGGVGKKLDPDSIPSLVGSASTNHGFSKKGARSKGHSSPMGKF